MGRGKLPLQLIPKEKARKLTFERRNKGLLKKAKEFSILCGVDSCAIVYGTPVISDRPQEPEIFPADPSEVRCIIERYMGHGAKTRSFGLSDFFVNRKKKLETELVKARSAVWETKYPVSDDVVENFPEDELMPLFGVLGDRLGSAKKRLAELKASRDAAINNMKDADMSTPVAAEEFESDFRQHIPSHCSFYEPMPVHMKFPFQPGQCVMVPAPPAAPELQAGYHGTGLFCNSNNCINNNIPHQYYGHQTLPITQHAAQSDPQLAGHYHQMYNCFSGSQHHHHQYYDSNMVGGIFPAGMLHDQGDRMFGNVNNNFGGSGLYNGPSSSISSPGPTDPYYHDDVSVMNQLVPAGQVHQWGILNYGAAAADHEMMIHANHYIH